MNLLVPRSSIFLIYELNPNLVFKVVLVMKHVGGITESYEYFQDMNKYNNTTIQ